MAAFQMDFGADPKWLHVARTVAAASGGTLDADVEFIEDLTLAVGEAALEVCVTPGVSTLGIKVDSTHQTLAVSIVGRGTQVDHSAGTNPATAMVLEAVTDAYRVSREDTEYLIDLEITIGRSRG